MLIYAGIFLHQKPLINSLIIPILGFATPLILFFTYCFGIDEVYTFTNLFYFDALSFVNFYKEGNFYSIALFMVLLAAFGIVLKSPKALAVNNSFKKSWLLLVLHLVIAITYNLLQPHKNGTELLFLIFPVAVLGANGFEALKNKILKNLFLLLLLASIFIVPFVL
ncbi:hypothetical protein [uncultured Polaribacter sp.]|uniref:hypothetical protein n=1 Tax=uncultured Polaribacter sp. TaxID=174711 RepID=UPI0026332C1A|nr:hypothetical protein [uncultured Polaribacter sp.]